MNESGRKDDNTVGAASGEDGAELQKPNSGNNKKKAKAAKLQKTEYLYIGVMVMAVLAIVLTLALVFGLKKDDQVIRASRAPSVPPAPASSATPSVAPTSILDDFVASLPIYSLEALQSPFSPQSLALAWLQEHPVLWDISESRKEQLFALATFFYSFDGQNWPEFIRNDWLAFDRSECVWFSSVLEDDWVQ